MPWNESNRLDDERIKFVARSYTCCNNIDRWAIFYYQQIYYRTISLLA